MPLFLLLKCVSSSQTYVGTDALVCPDERRSGSSQRDVPYSRFHKQGITFFFAPFAAFPRTAAVKNFPATRNSGLATCFSLRPLRIFFAPFAVNRFSPNPPRPLGRKVCPSFPNRLPLDTIGSRHRTAPVPSGILVRFSTTLIVAVPRKKGTPLWHLQHSISPVRISNASSAN